MGLAAGGPSFDYLCGLFDSPSDLGLFIHFVLGGRIKGCGANDMARYRPPPALAFFFPIKFSVPLCRLTHTPGQPSVAMVTASRCVRMQAEQSVNIDYVNRRSLRR